MMLVLGRKAKETTNPQIFLKNFFDPMTENTLTKSGENTKGKNYVTI